MVVGFVGAKRVMSFVEVEFMVVHMPRIAHNLTKSALPTKTRSLQLYLIWSVFSPRARGDVGGRAKLVLFCKCQELGLA